AAAEDTRARREAAAVAYEQAVALRKAGKHAEALAAFEEAYRREPFYKVLYDIGAEHANLGHWGAARRALGLYLELGDGELSPQRVAEVHVHLDALAKRTATLTLTLNVAEADVKIDGEKPQETSISGLILDAGTHVVRVSKPGFRPVEEQVTAG